MNQPQVTLFRASTFLTASTNSLSLHRELRLGLLLQIVVTILAQPGDLGAEDEILDLDFALLFLVAALDDDAGRAALVGVFHLRAELAGAEIKLGANVFPGAYSASRSFATMRW